MQLAKDKIFDLLKRNQIRHQFEEFPSGCAMLDFWVNERLFVIQLEPKGIGFSEVTEEIDLSTIPDEWHYQIDDLLKKIRLTIKDQKKSN